MGRFLRCLQVSMDRTPVGISIPVAADILFIGKAVRVLRKPGGAFRRQELLPAEDMLAATEALSRLQDQPFFSRVEFERVVEQASTAHVNEHCSVCLLG
jgi:hypothetical protein